MITFQEFYNPIYRTLKYDDLKPIKNALKKNNVKTKKLSTDGLELGYWYINAFYDGHNDTMESLYNIVKNINIELNPIGIYMTVGMRNDKEFEFTFNKLF